MFYDDHINAKTADANENSLQRQLSGYRLTTAEIIDHPSDHPQLWQQHYIAPHFSELRCFLHFWETKLEGKLHLVKVASAKLITLGEIKNADGLFAVH